MKIVGIRELQLHSSIRDCFAVHICLLVILASELTLAGEERGRYSGKITSSSGHEVEGRERDSTAASANVAPPSLSLARALMAA